MYFPGCSTCHLASVGLIFKNSSFLKPQNAFLCYGRRKSSSRGQKAKVRRPNWRENRFGGPRSEATVAPRGPRSRDPKYPVENLLNPDSPRRPWLSCPQDKSGQLKVELQLERAVPIGYIDVGNCGCAFLQIDVGRSSWPLDRPFITLLPATTLMSLTDSRQGKNRSGVCMFKDVDFLAPASGELWDRLRLTCSQPFTHHQSFGLAFLRVRSSLDSLDDSVVGPSALVSSVLNKVGVRRHNPGSLQDPPPEFKRFLGFSPLSS
ncbi:protein XNDC1N isoform X2 [Gorilla gorilla gorilla]|uniref:protein XNDC1N isoform X2 n=1 Tax=Gorilla gorilla gorilla TaxID=9595 RepID=UPI002445A926|nr:protein XNDC1N isoform X3 [Gorilla gorilla gorilla]